MDFPDDPGLVRVLRHLGVLPQGLLGHGGEAWVYAIDQDLVVRVLHDGGTRDQIRCNEELVDELRGSTLPFAMPTVVQVGEWGGRTYSIERRLPGVSLLDALDVIRGSARDRMIEAHLEAAARLGSIPLGPRDHFGDLVGTQPVHATTWRQYLQRKAEAALALGGLAARVDASALAAALPEPEPGAVGLAHLDAFAGNMMVEGERVTAVLDIGSSCVRGDTRFNALAACVYLEAPVTTPNATDRDRQIARSWIESRGLSDLLEPARAWLAAYWSFEIDDSRIRSWVHAVLGLHGGMA